MLTLIEWYLGIEPAGSGEAARWSFTWGGAEFSYAWLVTVLGAGAVLIAFLSRQEAQRRSVRWLHVWALRTCILMIVAAWLGGLTLKVVRTGLPTIVLMIDTSASMGLEDFYESPLREQTDSRQTGRGTRLAIAKQWLLRDNARLVRELARRYRLRVYEFADEPRLIGHSTTDEDLAATIQEIDDSQSAGLETRPGPALDRTLADYRGGPPAAAVVISDGIASLATADKLSSAVQPGKLGVPLFTIPTGSRDAALDLEIYDLRVDPVVFAGDTVSVDVTARGIGLNGRRAEFELQQAGRSASLDRSTITISEDGQPSSVRLSFTPQHEGDFELIVAAESDVEELNRENNVLRRHVLVRQGQFRVLLMDRAPRWEYRHLKAVLERDPNIELRTVLQESDLNHQREDRTALAGFPATRDDLFEYDVVIIGDVDLQYLNPGALELVQDFVAARGGGLILIAGERHNPSDFEGTPMQPLLPVQPMGALREQPQPPTRLVPAAGSFDHPLLRISEDSRRAVFWEDLPMLNWWLPVRSREPGGVAIATRAGSDTPETLIALQRFGGGVVLFHATDELWRWRKRVEDRYYGRYWRQAVRFVCRAAQLGQSGALEIATDRSIYQHGESVRFRVRVFDSAVRETAHEQLTIQVEHERGDARSVSLVESSEVAGEFCGVLPSAGTGAYVARLSIPSSVETATECRFRVEPPHRELQRQAAEIEDLQRAARATNGIALAYDQVDELPSRLPHGEATAVLSTEMIPIWARAEWLLLFVGLLAAEWLLRRSG